MTKHNDIIAFWYEEIQPKQWWTKDPEFDEMIKTRFLKTHTRAVRGDLSPWRDDPLGRLAEVIVIDQFSRNMFRGHPDSFRFDPIALVLAQEGVRSQADQKIPSEMRSFLYMPYMHSESLLAHEEAKKLFAGSEGNLKALKAHTAILEKFGRYPHRNEILGRQSTPEEIEFLKTPGSSF